MTAAFTPTPGLQPSASTVVTLYTALANNCIVPMILALNVTGTPDTFTIHRVPSGFSLSNLTKIANNEPLAGNERKVLTEKWFLNLGDSIQVVSSGGNVVFHTNAIENSADA